MTDIPKGAIPLSALEQFIKDNPPGPFNSRPLAFDRRITWMFKNASDYSKVRYDNEGRQVGHLHLDMETNEIVGVTIYLDPPFSDELAKHFPPAEPKPAVSLDAVVERIANAIGDSLSGDYYASFDRDDAKPIIRAELAEVFSQLTGGTNGEG